MLDFDLMSQSTRLPSRECAVKHLLGGSDKVVAHQRDALRLETLPDWQTVTGVGFVEYVCHFKAPLINSLLILVPYEII